MTRPQFLVSLFQLLVFLVFLSLALANPVSAVTVDDVEQVSAYKMRLKVETSASQETIWQLWEDVENWKQFDEILLYSMLDEGHSFELGATGVVKAKGAPKSKFKLIEVTPGVSFTERLTTPLWQSIDLLRYFEEGKDGKTIFVHEVHFKGSLKWIIYAAAGKTFKKELPRVMNNLKEVAEAQSSSAEN